MPTYTTRLGLTMPQGTDRVMDGDDAIRANAQKLDFVGVDSTGSLAPWAGTVPPVGNPARIFTAVTQAATDVNGVFRYPWPAGMFTYAIFFASATIRSGVSTQPVINNTQISLTEGQWFISGGANKTITVAILAIGY
jgi:hypothetical protein